MIAVAFLLVAVFAFAGGVLLGNKLCQKAGRCKTAYTDQYSSSDTVVISEVVPTTKKRRGKRKK